MNKFKPDLIMISAGFDGHEYEYINKGKMKLNEFDFAYICLLINIAMEEWYLYSKGGIMFPQG